MPPKTIRQDGRLPFCGPLLGASHDAEAQESHPVVSSTQGQRAGRRQPGWQGHLPGEAQLSRQPCRVQPHHGEWAAHGGTLQQYQANDLTVTELAAAYLRHATSYYPGPDGKLTREVANFNPAIRRLTRLYGRTRAVDFAPIALMAVQQAMTDEGLAIRTTNHSVNRIRRIFCWGVESRLIPAIVLQRLQAVAGLRYGRSGAKETAAVKPVPVAFVAAVRPHVSCQVAAMMELQRITGMRSGEVGIMRAADVNMAGKVWVYSSEPLLSENEALALRALLRRAYGVDVELPAENQRHQQAAWFAAVYCAFSEVRVSELANHARQRLLNPKGCDHEQETNAINVDLEAAHACDCHQPRKHFVFPPKPRPRSAPVGTLRRREGHGLSRVSGNRGMAPSTQRRLRRARMIS